MSTSFNAARRPQSFQYPPPLHTYSRPTYPSFLSVQSSLYLQLTWAGRGLYDACRWNVIFTSISGDAEIRTNVYKSLLLNSLTLISIYVFDLLLLPLIEDQQRWFHRNIGWFYQVLWLFPIVGISFYLNSSWCSIVAKRTYTLLHGQTAHQQQVTYTGMLTAIATSAYRVVMIFTSVVISFALRNISYVGPTAGFFFLCWMDAYYCFEFVWIARGLSLSRRVRHLEERWAYYFAFGLPSAALCTCTTGLANAAIFALIFPLFIILAMHARPVPLDPYNPLLPAASPSGEPDTIRHPSPFIPIRLPIFAVVIWLNDLVIRILSVGGGGRRKSSAHSRALSDATESVEDGEVVELRSIPKQPTRLTQNRINIGRRKLD